MKRNRAGRQRPFSCGAEPAEASERSTAAQVLQAKANVDVARTGIRHRQIAIAGRAGQQRVTEGALVVHSDATLLTTVEQIDPIYVNFDQPAAEVQRLRRQQTEGNVTLVDRNAPHVQVILQDGTPYAHQGTLDFLDFSVNPTTGALAFRAVVPNPDRQLLPGMYVNLHLLLGQLNRAYLVPQAGLQRDTTGPFVKVVDAEGKVAQKRVTSDRAVDGSWIVTSGLADGDQLIVTNFAKARPGSPVKAVAAEAPETNAPTLPQAPAAPASLPRAARGQAPAAASKR
jgi:membrane fusion protein (multidrug efflux system)